jgi:hypothetical protein
MNRTTIVITHELSQIDPRISCMSSREEQSSSRGNLEGVVDQEFRRRMAWFVEKCSDSDC